MKGNSLIAWFTWPLFGLCALFATVGQAQPQYAEQPPSGVAWGWHSHVLFDLNSAKLRPEAKSTLDAVSAILRASPAVSVLLTGHTDNTGNVGYNQQLSIKRGAAVTAYLAQQGVDRDRIQQRAVGEQRPVAGNVCDADRRRNRRVDIAFFPTGRQAPAPEDMLLPESAPDRRQESEECR